MFPHDAVARMNFIVQYPRDEEAEDDSIPTMKRGRVMLPEQVSEVNDN
jgi:hypothetical protein